MHANVVARSPLTFLFVQYLFDKKDRLWKEGIGSNLMFLLFGLEPFSSNLQRQIGDLDPEYIWYFSFTCFSKNRYAYFT